MPSTFELENTRLRSTSRISSSSSPVSYPLKQILVSAFLLLGGLTLVGVAARLFAIGHTGGGPALTLGVIMTVPGAYSAVIVTGTMREWKGYDFSQLPGYEREADFV